MEVAVNVYVMDGLMVVAVDVYVMGGLMVVVVCVPLPIADTSAMALPRLTNLTSQYILHDGRKPHSPRNLFWNHFVIS